MIVYIKIPRPPLTFYLENTIYRTINNFVISGENSILFEILC